MRDYRELGHKTVSEYVYSLTHGIVGEMKKVVAGNDDILFKIIYCLLADNHVLLESYPGLAKSLIVDAMPVVIGGSRANRIQFTADLLPKDIVGVRVWNEKERKFEIEKGPVHCINFLNGDEINRAPGKVQGALLSAMQERRVIINGEVFLMEDPFLVLASQNPIEQEGTYPLPEAQVDRFGIKLRLDYVDYDDEMSLLDNDALRNRDPQLTLKPVCEIGDIVSAREAIKSEVYISRAAKDYIIRLVRSTRPRKADGTPVPEFLKVQSTHKLGKQLNQVKLGGSPRAQMTLRNLAAVRAAGEGRDFVLPEDIRAMIYDVLRHRVLLTDEAQFEGISSDSLVEIVVDSVELVKDETQYRKPR